jgi:hypothetical protein
VRVPWCGGAGRQGSFRSMSRGSIAVRAAAPPPRSKLRSTTPGSPRPVPPPDAPGSPPSYPRQRRNEGRRTISGTSSWDWRLRSTAHETRMFDWGLYSLSGGEAMASLTARRGRCVHRSRESIRSSACLGPMVWAAVRFGCRGRVGVVERNLERRGGAAAVRATERRERRDMERDDPARPQHPEVDLRAPPDHYQRAPSEQDSHAPDAEPADGAAP